MPRSRNIKPAFFKNEQLAECDPWARLLFVGLWCIADRRGVLEDRPRKIRAELFPHDEIDANEKLDQLASHGLIVRYEDDNVRCVYIPTFAKHQRPHQDEKPNDLPAYTGQKHRAVSTVQAAQGSSHSAVAPADSLLLNADYLIPESLIPERDLANAKSGVASATLSSSQANCDGSSRIPPAEIDAVVRHYQHYHPRSRPGDKERKLIAARLREGYSMEDLCQAIDGNHRDPFCCGDNARGKQYHNLSLIVRDSDHVRDYIEVANAPDAPVLSEKTRQSLRAGQAWLKRMEDADHGVE